MLLSRYMDLWQNRTYDHSGESAAEELQEAVRRDLNDEWTHPRVRKGPSEKFAAAAKRIVFSNLSAEEKTALLAIYLEVLEEI